MIKFRRKEPAYAQEMREVLKDLPSEKYMLQLNRLTGLSQIELNYTQKKYTRAIVCATWIIAAMTIAQVLIAFFKPAPVSSQSIFNSLTAYPNPLTQSTIIQFTSPESGVARVTVVNLLGEEVARVFDGTLSAGEHSFTWNAGTMPAGMYECIVDMNGSVQQAPMMVTR